MFKLSTKIRYGTRAIIRIAAEGGKGAVSLGDVSKAESISLKYLENIISSLKKSGLVSSVKGPKGGYVVAKPLSKITLLDIAKALEGEMVLVDCCADEVNCERKGFCPTYETWFELSEVMKKSMRSIILSDLVKKDEKKLKNKKANVPGCLKKKKS